MNRYQEFFRKYHSDFFPSIEEDKGYSLYLEKSTHKYELLYQHKMPKAPQEIEKIEGIEFTAYTKRKFGIVFDEKNTFSKEDLLQDLHALRPLFSDNCMRERSFDFNMQCFEWVKSAKKIRPDVCHWIGIYFKYAFLLEKSDEKLILGPFLGPWTSHEVIAFDQGICGLAVETEETINVPDVKSDPRYLSCSIETQSELVLPIRDKKGRVIGELDIDSPEKNSFDNELVKEMQSHVETFPLLLDEFF